MTIFILQFCLCGNLYIRIRAKFQHNKSKIHRSCFDKFNVRQFFAIAPYGLSQPNDDNDEMVLQSHLSVHSGSAICIN